MASQKPDVRLDVPEKAGGETLKRVTQLLQIVAILVLAYSALRWYSFSTPESLPVLEKNRFEQKIAVRDEPDPDAPTSFADYGQVFSSREIFAIPYAKESPAPRAAPVESPGAQKAQLLDFRLRGVVLDRHPQAIIEDVSSKQTLFLSPGDELGQGTLKEVREDRIIVVIRDSALELLLED